MTSSRQQPVSRQTSWRRRHVSRGLGLFGLVCVLASSATAQTLVVGTVGAAQGQQVSLPVTLDGGDATVATIVGDLTFSAATPIIATASGAPSCTVNASLQKENTAFTFLPSGCAGTQCTGVRAIVTSHSNAVTIPGGYTLFTCVVQVSAASGIYPVTAANVVMFNFAGEQIDAVEARDGYVSAGGGC